MAKSKKTNDALQRLAEAEQQFLKTEFLAPAVHGGQVHVRIAGVVCQLKIEPADFEGWGVFAPMSYTEALLVRPANLSERQSYLNLFPIVRLILARKDGGWWRALPAHQADRRFRIEGLVPVLLPEDVQLFDVVQARFDGCHFWFDCADPTRDPGAATYLRQSLDAMSPPDQVTRPELTAEERAAYAASYQVKYEASEQARRDHEEERLRSALAHAGAKLRDYRERDDVYTITYDVDGRRHTSAIDKRDLSVRMAGICLSGEDERFDLQSLVGVIREAQDGHGLVCVGNQGLPEEHYWAVHPRRRRP